MNNITTTLLFGGLSSILFALSNVIDKYSSKKIKSPLSYAIIKGLFNVMILFFLSYVFFNLNSIIEATKLSLKEAIYTIFGLIIFSLAYISFLILLIKKKTGNIVALVNILVLVIQVLTGIFFFHDKVNYFVLVVSLILVILGILIIHDFNIRLNLNLKEWVLLIINVVGFAFFSFYITLISKELNKILHSKAVPILATFIGESVSLMSFFLLLLLIIILKKFKIRFFLVEFFLKNFNLKEQIKNLKNIFYSFLGSILIVASVISLIVATTFGIYSIASIVSYLSILWTALISSYLFKEKLKKHHHLGFILTIFGIILLKFV